MSDPGPLPTEIILHSRSRMLELHFSDGEHFQLSCEYLRVFSPSAEVQGHHGQGATLQIGKETVNIKDLQQVGNYAVKLFFDDGHKSGLYTWRYLHELGRNQAAYWKEYLARLQAAGHERTSR